MPYFEVEVTCKKCIAVEADTPEDAEEKAEDLSNEFVRQYREQGELI
jgi:hypothetical protein